MANLTKEEKSAEHSVRAYRKADASRRAKFLRALARTGNVTHSAAHAGISRRNIYQYAEKNKRFANRMADTIETFRASLEAEAIRRGRDGYGEEVYQNGELIGFKTKYSDRLLMATLAAHNPETYGKQTITVEGDENKPIALTAIRSAPPIDVNALRASNAGDTPALALFEDGDT